MATTVRRALLTRKKNPYFCGFLFLEWYCVSRRSVGVQSVPQVCCRDGAWAFRNIFLFSNFAREPACRFFLCPGSSVLCYGPDTGCKSWALEYKWFKTEKKLAFLFRTQCTFQQVHFSLTRLLQSHQFLSLPLQSTFLPLFCTAAGAMYGMTLSKCQKVCKWWLTCSNFHHHTSHAMRKKTLHLSGKLSFTTKTTCKTVHAVMIGYNHVFAKQEKMTKTFYFVS